MIEILVVVVAEPHDQCIDMSLFPQILVVVRFQEAHTPENGVCRTWTRMVKGIEICWLRRCVVDVDAELPETLSARIPGTGKYPSQHVGSRDRLPGFVVYEEERHGVILELVDTQLLAEHSDLNDRGRVVGELLAEEPLREGLEHRHLEVKPMRTAGAGSRLLFELDAPQRTKLVANSLVELASVKLEHIFV
jgi:hypothetical protein